MSLVFSKIRRSTELVATAGVMLLGMALASLPVLAQSYYGVVRGFVTDQKGGALVSAKVTIVNEGTAEQRSTLTSGNGEYVFNEVVPATYSVVCESAGFKKSSGRGSSSPPRDRSPRT